MYKLIATPKEGDLIKTQNSNEDPGLIYSRTDRVWLQT